MLYCNSTLLLVLLATTLNASQYLQAEKQSINNQTNYNQKYNDTIEQLIVLSELYWSTDKKKSDSLISKAFSLISNNVFVDSLILADAYHMLGKVLIQNNDARSGVDSLKKSLFIKQRVITNDYKSLAKTLNYIGRGYLALQEFDSTIYYCKRSKELLTNNNIKDRNLYFTYLNIGISYASLGKYNNAINYFDTALIALTESGEINDSIIIAGYYYNYALLTTLTGKLKEANHYFEKSEAIFVNKLGNANINLAGINNNKGINAYYNYEFSKAELYYKKALDIYIANNANAEKIPLIYYNLSQVSRNTGDFFTSINYCLSGLQNSPENDLRLILYKNIAQSYAEVDNVDEANYYFKVALELIDKENINPKRRQELYSCYADFLVKIKNYSMALMYYNKALESTILLHGYNTDQYAMVLIQIGTYYLENKKNADSAIHYFSKSISIFNENKVDTGGANLNIMQEGKAHVGYASALALKFKQTNEIELLNEADTIFAQVLNKFEKVFNNLSTVNKLLLTEITNPVYNLAIENSYDIYNLTNDTAYIEKIFNYSERSKSSALLSDVNSELALKTSDIPDEIFRYEHQLKDEINGLMQLLENEKTEEKPSDRSISFFETKLLILLNKYDSLIISIERDYPKYYSVKYGREVISLSQTKMKLKDDEAIIEYQLTDSVLFITTITNNEFDIKKISVDSSFFNSLSYIISIKNIDLSQHNITKFNEFKLHSHKLWKTLIEPSQDLFDNKRLIIIPDGLLGYLPFDLLIEYDFETDGINYRDLPYLIKNHPISYSYSATLKFNTYFHQNKKKPIHNLLAFAPSYSDSLTTLRSDKNQSLKNLPFAKDEVYNILKSQGGRAYYDKNATKSNFLKHANSNNIIHLAMHTIINDSLPLQSKLVFYEDMNDTSSNHMFTHEIYNMDLSASMVTLSACNTGTGKFRKGEGIMSLARGFVYAGVPSIVMTLWEAQDESGSKIMSKYYEYLKEGLTKDVAMQQAKLSMLNNANMAKSHPFFWSAYIISGDTSVINFSKQSNYYYWIIALSFVIVVVIVLYKRSRKLFRTHVKRIKS